MHDEVKSAAVNPYHMAVQQFELAAEKLNLSEDMREILRQPKRELIVPFDSITGISKPLLVIASSTTSTAARRRAASATARMSPLTK
jgi:hypothetical protein